MLKRLQRLMKNTVDKVATWWRGPLYLIEFHDMNDAVDTPDNDQSIVVLVFDRRLTEIKTTAMEVVDYFYKDFNAGRAGVFSAFWRTGRAYLTPNLYITLGKIKHWGGSFPVPSVFVSSGWEQAEKKSTDLQKWLDEYTNTHPHLQQHSAEFVFSETSWDAVTFKERLTNE